MLQPDVTTASFGDEEELDEDEEREKQAEMQNFLNAASEHDGNLWDVSFSSLGDVQDRGIDFTHEEEAIIKSAGQPLFGKQYLTEQPAAAAAVAAVQALPATAAVGGLGQYVAAQPYSPPSSSAQYQADRDSVHRRSNGQSSANSSGRAADHRQMPIADSQRSSWHDLAKSSSDYQVSQLTNQLLQHQHDNQHLQQKVVDLQQEHEKQQRIHHHYLELQKQETHGIQGQLEDCEIRLKHVEAENQSLRRQLADASRLADEASQSKVEAVVQVDSLKSTISSLQLQLQQVSSSQSLNRLQEENEKQLEQLREKQRTDTAVQQQMTDSVRGQLVKEQGAVHRLEAEVAVLTSEVQQLRLERDMALRRASLPGEGSNVQASCRECTNVGAACKVTERHCDELKGELEAVGNLLRSLPCWDFDEDDIIGGLGTATSSLMVTPGVVQHSTPLSTSSRLPASCRDVVTLLSVRVKKLQEVAKSSYSRQHSASDGQLNQQRQELTSLRLQLSQLGAERDSLMTKTTKLEAAQSSSTALEVELKSRIEALQQELKKQWQAYEEDKKTSLESFYSQLMDLHGNSSQRLKERMQMASSAERQNLLVSHAEELSNLRSEFLAAQSEATRVKEEYVRLRENTQTEKRVAQGQAKAAHDSAVEVLRRSHEKSLQQVDERHRQDFESQVSRLKEQHRCELAELQAESSSQRLAFMQQAQLQVRSARHADSSTQTENGPVMSSVQKHLTQDLMKIAVELFHKCIREWEARQRVS